MSEATHDVLAPFAGTVLTIVRGPGERIAAGEAIAVLESMKMEHEVLCGREGVVSRLEVSPGETVEAGMRIAVVITSPEAADAIPAADDRAACAPGPRRPGGDLRALREGGAPDTLGGAGRPSAAGRQSEPAREDLEAVRQRHLLTSDAARPEAVARRHRAGRRTARENLAALLDPGSFVEYGPLVFAAQEGRRPRRELIERTPADGLVGGLGTVDGQPVVAMSYDYTVLAGTQGWRNHAKKDRLFELARRRRLPVVLFAEGGGGRPGDVDYPVVAGLDCRAFELFASLSGLVPLIGIVAGLCFAGNAALLGCCDVIIATEGTSIGMGGPAMIEGGGLGQVAAAEVGPVDVQWENGVVDILVADEPAAVPAAQKVLGLLAGGRDRGSSGAASGPLEPSHLDAELLRSLVPPQRKRVYDVGRVIEALLDPDSVLELRGGFARGMRTVLGRFGGRPLGVIANDPASLGGAIDAPGADKAARFMQLCDAHGLPILFLCDTPGFMVGPQAERAAAVRHVSRMFLVGANLSVPLGTVVLRKAYGLGAQAMAGGSFRAPEFVVGWPTSEFGGMGLEGAVKLGMRRELEAIADPDEREAAYRRMVAAAYERGGGLNTAAHGEIDDVIDPADTWRFIATLFDTRPERRSAPDGKRRPHIDAW
jgi:acetyl-CoA carboxylase carboxyltransferase component